MSQLPPDRVDVENPRSEIKRYGVIFTCLTLRAVHLEIASDLSTDAFIMALRRFMARRGQPKIIRCDNGTNFVGAVNELKENINKWNQSQIDNFLLQHNVKWIFNPPSASHVGGVWERLIRSVRKILLSLTNEQILSDESLNTFICEAEVSLTAYSKFRLLKC